MVLNTAGLIAITGFDIWIGIIGALFIAAAWSYEMWESIERHKSLIDLRFAGIYLIGNILLLMYALLLRDVVFIAVNTTIAILVLFEIAYTIGWKFGRTKRRRK
ncbi:MAG: lipid-A-disaccharide synthase N-terminal domain-containing protein [Candidatus Aenigmatarchaeota archaeon]|nr:lipid-A-disaccharide synthase N-terminal domain-containing protein [Candidatus Aenigmarchaeota archaeon]